MSYGVGWHEYELHANPEHADAADGLPEPGELEALREVNGLDGQLYEYGVVLARLDGIMYDVAAAAGFDLRPAGWLACGRLMTRTCHVCWGLVTTGADRMTAHGTGASAVTGGATRAAGAMRAGH